jgi:hypothetical protein
MRQWLEAGYFKGDLPISQSPTGPFHALSVWFPDLKFAFTPQPTNGKDQNQILAEEQARAKAAEEERLRKEAEAAERERRAAEEAQRVAQEAARREAEQREAAAREAERQRQDMAAKAAEAKNDTGANESSNQLKMMLGLSSGAQQNAMEAAEKAEMSTPSKNKMNEKKGKGKKAPQKGVDETVAPNSAPQPTAPAPASAAPAWGGAAINKQQSRKSMSEIQQEEARAAAMLAAQRGSMPQSSSGWANVAAGTSGWSSGAIRQSNSAAAVAGGLPSQARPVNQNSVVQSGTSRKVAPLNQQQRASSTASATSAEDFGATIPPAIEKWSREKISPLTGSEDIALIAFCMTLDDANEIRQYFTTYLGSSPQVTSLANEFINKRGLGTKQEEWETPGSAKKGRKKKSGR